MWFFWRHFFSSICFWWYLRVVKESHFILYSRFCVHICDGESLFICFILQKADVESLQFSSCLCLWGPGASKYVRPSGHLYVCVDRWSIWGPVAGKPLDLPQDSLIGLNCSYFQVNGPFSFFSFWYRQWQLLPFPQNFPHRRVLF